MSPQRGVQPGTSLQSGGQLCQPGSARTAEKCGSRGPNACGVHWSPAWPSISAGCLPLSLNYARARDPVDEPEVANKASELPVCAGSIREDHHSHASAPARCPLLTVSAKRTQRPGDHTATRGNSPAGTEDFGSWSRRLRRSVMSDRTGARSVQTPGPIALCAWSCRQHHQTASKRPVVSAIAPRR